ncbi:GH3 family domain-containing protein [Chitinimonas lacunae]|uniref:GH3 auxin-responsive promoter family protein n=1 Tax=Chitinimonas lacunae TaxID=1963018 RepID=A0ABV8MQ95_9NEIS
MSEWHELYLLGQRQLIGRPGCRTAQAAWLADCLRRNAACEYLRGHGLDGSGALASFRSRLPLVDYDTLRPWIDRVTAGEADVLFAGRAVACESTGGSGGGAKLIPYSAHSLADFRRALLGWLADVIRSYNIGTGHAYWAISPATRSLPEPAPQVPYGLSDADYLGPEALPLFARLSAVDLAVAGCRELGAWQLATLRDLLTCHDLSLVSVWSPTFFLSLLEAIPDQAEALRELLGRGGTLGTREVMPDPAALERLDEYLRKDDPAILWPGLKLISCWADGASRPYFARLRRLFPSVTLQPKGLLSTEAVVSIPDSSTGQALLSQDSGFFEFLDEGGEPLLADEIVISGRYEVVITTAGGLYRYRTGDIVTCTGHGPGGQPALRFVGRGNLSSDLVGEKLTDEFVQRALADLAGFRALVADAASRRYVLVFDSDADEATGAADRVESRLMRNPQYAYARALGQLQPLAARRVRQAQHRYIARMLTQGRRLGDIKMPGLLTAPEWLDIFAA